MTDRSPPPSFWGGEFRHQALLYAGREQFLASTASFIRDAIANGEPVLVVLSGSKIERLRSELDQDVDRVVFANMDEVGRNPARIIPVWHDFVEEHAGTAPRCRGIGEPVWPERSSAELAECYQHEFLLNLAFDRRTPWWLLCPYDTAALDPIVIEAAYRTHPLLLENGDHRESPSFGALDLPDSSPEDPLPPPPPHAETLEFGERTLDVVRLLVESRARSAGLSEARTSDLVLAMNELASNSVRHGGGHGTLRIWTDPMAVICEITDRGHISDPLVGRRRPAFEPQSARGLWIANQICDLLQLRSSPRGTVVRMHVRYSVSSAFPIRT